MTAVHLFPPNRRPLVRRPGRRVPRVTNAPPSPTAAHFGSSGAGVTTFAIAEAAPTERCRQSQHHAIAALSP